MSPTGPATPPWLWDAQRLQRTLRQRRGQLPAVVDPYGAALPAPGRPAAVLVPFVPGPQGWHLLFIQRARHPHDPHSGQVSFPGGRVEPTDPTAQHTARRETHEEIGLPPSAIELWAALPLHRTASNYWVHPWVGRVTDWPRPLRLQPAEVARVFTVPLAWLAQPQHLERHRRMVHGVAVPTYTFPWHTATIWGATARIVVSLLYALGLTTAPPWLPPARRVPSHWSDESEG